MIALRRQGRVEHDCLVIPGRDGLSSFHAEKLLKTRASVFVRLTAEDYRSCRTRRWR